MSNSQLDYYEYPLNGDNIRKARTFGLVRSWQFSRSTQSLKSFRKEIGCLAFPGIYLLFESNTHKVYIGQTKNLYNQLRKHNNTPKEKFKNWDMVLVINDGRYAAQSDFNDSVVRYSLKSHLNSVFQANKYQIINHVQNEKCNSFQKTIVGILVEELNFFLVQVGLIDKCCLQKYN